MNLHPVWRKSVVRPRLNFYFPIIRMNHFAHSEQRNIIFNNCHVNVFCCNLKEDRHIKPFSTRNFQNSTSLHSLCERHFSTRLLSRLSQSEDRILRQKPPWRILFFGTDNFSLHTLRVLAENRNVAGSKLVESLEVVTKQKCPVRTYAEQNGLHLSNWPIRVSMEEYDVGVLVSFGKLIPQNIIKMFPYGIINIHPSLLPRWRGSAPIPHTILNGDTEAGISIMHIRPSHFDQGPLLLQKHYTVNPRSTSLDLAEDLGSLGSQMILRLLEDLPSYIQNATAQKKEGVTLARKLKPSMGCVNWKTQTCKQIDHQYRAFHEVFPLRSEWFTLPVKLLEFIKSDENVNEAAVKHFKSDVFLPGQPFYSRKENVLYIRCKDGWVGFKKIVLRKPLTAKDFDCGYLSKSSSKNVAFTSLNNGLFKYS